MTALGRTADFQFDGYKEVSTRTLIIRPEPFSADIAWRRSKAYKTGHCPLIDGWESRSIHLCARLDGRLIGALRLVPLGVMSNQTLSGGTYTPTRTRGIAIERAFVFKDADPRGLAMLYRQLICSSIALALEVADGFVGCLATQASTKPAEEAGFVQSPARSFITLVAGQKPREAWPAEWTTAGMPCYLALSKRCADHFSKWDGHLVECPDETRRFWEELAEPDGPSE